MPHVDPGIKGPGAEQPCLIRIGATAGGLAHGGSEAGTQQVHEGGESILVAPDLVGHSMRASDAQCRHGSEKRAALVSRSKSEW